MARPSWQSAPVGRDDKLGVFCASLALADVQNNNYHLAQRMATWVAGLDGCEEFVVE
jgi:hypothetical protein